MTIDLKIPEPQELDIAKRIAKIGLLAILITPVLQAQYSPFSGLSTTTDGSELYFASPLRMRGTDQALWSKIFRIDATGAALVAHVDQMDPVPPTNFYLLGSPQVSGDGTLLLYGASGYCGEGSSCFGVTFASSTLLNVSTGQSTVVGIISSMSRNGRYLASYGDPDGFSPQFGLIDRATSTTIFQGNFSPFAVSIASNGTTALVVPFALQLVRNGTLSTLVSSNVTAASIDDNADTIVYETQTPRRLFVLNLKTKQTQELGPSDRDSFQATMSADGQWVVFLSTVLGIPQAFYSRIDGSDWKQLTASAAGAVQVTLSGDHNTAFAIGGDYSILRIDTQTGASTTLVGPTPIISSALAPTPGSYSLVQGSGLAQASVNIGSTAGLILSRSDSQLAFQIPWETPLTANTLSIPEGGAPYFDDAISIQLAPFMPNVLPLAPPDLVTGFQPLAIHADFRSLVTNDNPAVPGEVLHMYFTGGGPVDVPVATGEDNPLSPLSKIKTPISVVAGSEPIDVPFVGLAPGLIGIWQIDAFVPANWSGTGIEFQIEFYSPPPNPFANAIVFGLIPVKIAR